ncbi:MAG TPA: FHA domain-containing protein [Dehalococcoidia bacterium]|nr:FHA domain-containing protein [Dehalococcoidia bacterium]
MPVRLVAVTQEARQAATDVEVVIDRFPFKVGRESRNALTKLSMSIERRMGATPQLNDVYLIEPLVAQFLHISREHFLIDEESGRYFLVDRGSVCGTIVSGNVVGGDRQGGRTEVHDGDEIIIGTAASPFVFKFLAS